MIDQRCSFNFAVAKVVAILLVVAGHYFGGPLIWAPVTVGLFVFAYSSAMFTARKYRGSFALGTFWHSKLLRLGGRFLLTQVFLIVLLWWQGASGILHWHTLVHLSGQSGWLNWLGVVDQSPLGMGLWFFTLLLIFYASFPLLARALSSPVQARVLALAVLIASLWLSRTAVVGHALWITAAAFFVGVCCGMHPLPGRAWQWGCIGGAGVLLLAVLNFALGVKSFNLELLLLVCLCAVQWLERGEVPGIFAPALLLSPLLLEIYFVHMYLFVRLSASPWLGFVLSLLLITAVSWILARGAGYLMRSLRR